MIINETKKEDNLSICRCDVTDRKSISDAGKIARQRFGNVTILINNAGIVAGKPLLEVSDFMAKKTIEVNTIGCIYTIKEFLPDMFNTNKGHIVNIASVASLVGAPSMGEYCASKAGLFMADECVRQEIYKFKKNIKTTCICPFLINTGMFEGSKGILLSNLLDQHYVVWRIITAIR